VANEPLMKANERMKTKNRDEFNANQSLSAVASCRRKHLFSETTPFAEISLPVGVAIFTAVCHNKFFDRRTRLCFHAA
jgi:hypothetical protein